MVKALHVYAVNGKTNSGDFFLGPATKNRFEKVIQQEVNWTNFDVRKIVTPADIKYFNTFDYLVLGGGGLFLPDTNPNKISCWQWACPTQLYREIQAPLYVISVGWNHFYGQDITMPNRNSNQSDPARLGIFKNNVEALIAASTSFTMRHTGDCEQLKKIVGREYYPKIKFAFCPVIEYIKEHHTPTFANSGEYHVFEIKDDRQNRRYHNTSVQQVYGDLLEYIKVLLAAGEKVAIMSHDGSRSFYLYLQKHGVSLPLLNNTVANEEAIIKNYAHVKKLYCTAGHSQMTACALQLDFYSLITHDKLKYFLEDIQEQYPYSLVNEQRLLADLMENK
tara:strand:+ start:1947 stop:2951 length:1005 start_codon:yes stop_codon:yes gene_type:complete